MIATDTNSFGTTVLTEVGNNYFLDGTAGTGPELQKGGVDVVAGQFPGWQPIGAAETATGYEVAWKLAGTDDYIVWSTNSSGNFLSQTAIVAGNSSTLEALEPSFNQDLNGDGVIGIPTTTTTPTIPTTSTNTPPTTVIATDTNSFGTTVLTEVGNNYFLDGTGGTGPELQKGGVNVVAGQFPGWQPIGAAETATGYEVAWKLAGTDDYIVWSTNSSGNFVSQTAIVAGNSSTLQALEPSFNQDLNGDGVIGSPTTVIQATGDTVLTLTTVTQAATIAAGATLELVGADSGSVTFNGSTGTLILDHSSTFTGQVLDLTGNGNASSSDVIDLKDVAFGSATESYVGTSSGGILTVSDAHA